MKINKEVEECSVSVLYWLRNAMVLGWAGMQRYPCTSEAGEHDIMSWWQLHSVLRQYSKGKKSELKPVDTQSLSQELRLFTHN